MDRSSHISNGLRDHFLVNVRRRCSAGVTHQALGRLDMALFLTKRRNGATNDLEGKVRQIQGCRELLEDTFTEVRGVDEAALFVGKNERLRRSIRASRLPGLEVGYQ